MARKAWHTRRVARVGAGCRRGARCVLTPGTGVPGSVRRCARPSAMLESGRAAYCPSPGPRRTVLRTPTRDRTRNQPGASVTEPGAVVHLEEGSRWTIPVQVHEPSNRMTASRPGGPSGRQSSSASSQSATTKPSGIGGLRRIRRRFGPRPAARQLRRRWDGGGAGPRVDRDPPGRLAPTPPCPGRASRSRPASPRRTARRPRPGRACGRGTCRTPGRAPRRPRGSAAWAARSRGPGRGPAVRSGRTLAGSRGPRCPPAGAADRTAARPATGSELAWFRGRYVALVSTRPVTGRVGLGAGGPPLRAVGSSSKRRPVGSACAVGRRVAGSDERGVGIVDLGHPARGDPRGGRIVAGQVRMVLAGETSPGSLDRRRAGAGLDAQDDMWIARHHDR